SRDWSSDVCSSDLDSYLTFPLDGLKSPEFSASFWYKINPSPGNAGILSIGDNADDRNQGLRLFREGPAESQTFKLNVGTGSGESWNHGGGLDGTTGERVHVASAISQSEPHRAFN